MVVGIASDAGLPWARPRRRRLIPIRAVRSRFRESPMVQAGIAKPSAVRVTPIRVDNLTLLWRSGGVTVSKCARARGDEEGTR